jgi:hypothetical protein
MPFDTDLHNSTMDRIPIFSNFDNGDAESNESFEFDENGSDDSESNRSFEFDDIYEDYSAPTFELPSHSNGIFTDSRFMWILLWIMNFRTKFNLSDIATEALIKFMKLVLIKIGGAEFEAFCGSLYTTKNFLGLSDQFVNFVACQKCHKLYNKEDVENFRQNNRLPIMKCTHVEYPNSATRRRRICNTALSIQSRLLNGSMVNRPKLVFPYATIRQQLVLMYRRPGFESNLRHWVNRSNIGNLLGDIYDSDI